MPKDARTFTPDQLRKHVYAIAAAFNIRIDEDPNRNIFFSGLETIFDSWTHRIVSQTVRIRPITDTFIYAIALHELGHAIAPNGMQNEYPYEGEESAWEWAESVALTWTPDMTVAKEIGLITHVKNKKVA